MNYRTEHDSMGDVLVPADRYWGAQTERSRQNFQIGVGLETMPREIVEAFGILKKVKMNGHTVRLTRLQPKIKKLFTICSLDQIIQLD